MSTASPNALLCLAIDSLLKDQALATKAVRYLPGELFPRVFREAIVRKHTEVIKTMVLLWPFPSLPLGTLTNMMKGGILDTEEDVLKAKKRVLQAVLDGLDVLLSQEDCSRRLKLQVLDMRDIHRKFWSIWCGNQWEESSMKWTREKTRPRVPNKKSFKIILDLWISDAGLPPEASFLLQWVKERGKRVQLDCPKLHVTAVHFQHFTDVLEIVDLDSVCEVDVSHHWTIFRLAQFAPFLGKLKNLHKLILCDICAPEDMSQEKRKQWISKITFQLRKLRRLQEVSMDTVDFLEGHFDQVLRCLTSPLETLSVINSQLSLSDWNLLPCCEQITQLKHFILSCTRLTSFSPEPLHQFLSSVSSTLTTLHLENCGITDAQVCAFLPSLSSCSQLTTFCFIKNFMSTDTMKNVLCHTAGLSKLNLEMYSVPKEVSVFMPGAHIQARVEIYEVLRGIMKPLNHPREVWFCTFNSEFWCHWKLYKQQANPCLGCILV